MTIAGNPNLLDALDLARRAGCEVYPRRGTGEVVVRVPGRPAPIVLNSRRKDTARALVVALRRLPAPSL